MQHACSHASQLFSGCLQGQLLSGCLQGQEHAFDVVGHPQSRYAFAVTLPFHSATSDRPGEACRSEELISHQSMPDAAVPPAQVTLLREYCQGPNCMLYVLPTGGFDPRKHKSLQECAAAEMSEEARGCCWSGCASCSSRWLSSIISTQAKLRGGTWVPLLQQGHAGIAEVKWCANRFQPFLCIDPQVRLRPALLTGKQSALTPSSSAGRRAAWRQGCRGAH